MKAISVLFLFCISNLDALTVTVISKYESELEKAKNQINEVASKITELQNGLDAGTVKDGHQKQGIAFTAILTKSISLGEKQIIKYDKVITNAGNSYNSATGYFTTPLSGIYSLSVSMMGNPSNGIHLQLVKNRNELVRLWTGGASSYELASQTINVKLDKGEKVWVQRRTSTGSKIYGSELYNVFSAALLYQ